MIYRDVVHGLLFGVYMQATFVGLIVDFILLIVLLNKLRKRMSPPTGCCCCGCSNAHFLAYITIFLWASGFGLSAISKDQQYQNCVYTPTEGLATISLWFFFVSSRYILCHSKNSLSYRIQEDARSDTYSIHNPNMC